MGLIRSRSMTSRLVVGMTVVVIAMFGPAGTAAHAYSCIDPDALDRDVIVADSASFFTGVLISIDRTVNPSTDRASFVAIYDVESVWHGPDLPKRRLVPYTLMYGGEFKVGTRYHVSVDDKGTSNACATFDASDLAWKVPTSARPPISDTPQSKAPAPAARDSSAWQWAIGAGALLMTGTLAAALVIVRRRQPTV